MRQPRAGDAAVYRCAARSSRPSKAATGSSASRHARTGSRRRSQYAASAASNSFAFGPNAATRLLGWGTAIADSSVVYEAPP